MMLALTRAEIIDRFRAPPVTQLEGLVQVIGDCPPDMRRDYQLPIASFASMICRGLYQAENIRPVKFQLPGVAITIGDVRTNLTDVIVRPAVRDDGAKYTRIRLPSPSGADLSRLRLEVIKAFYRAVKGEDLDDARAVRAYRRMDPLAHAADIAADIDAWRHGVYTLDRTDEDYLKLLRSVHTPGIASKGDVLVFASRLYLYPTELSVPFCGRYFACSFRDAVGYAQVDPHVRYAALLKQAEIVALGGGRGLKMDAAVTAYSKFLYELAKNALPEADLLKLLDAADAKLKEVLE